MLVQKELDSGHSETSRPLDDATGLSSPDVKRSDSRTATAAENRKFLVVRLR
jgi:hypothetical protein